ncbi:MAG TPA: AAA domain-containing protein [Pyrinomonadaceae bacterium]|nr:AAA domain-containing protein [Pyrinomonadaceae bacterium]
MPQTLPPETNRPENILSSWIALEVLSPQTYRRPEDLGSGPARVAQLSGPKPPWDRGERSRQNQRLYYQIVLGSIKMEPAVALLLERYGDTRPEMPSARGTKAALAIVVVNSQGHLVKSPAIGISSFGWGVITALKGELADLARWSDVESQLVEQIERCLTRSAAGEEEVESRPLTAAALFRAYEELVDELGIPGDWIEPPDFAIRSYTYYKDPNPPELLLLNSFFLADLAIARQLFSKNEAPHNLRRYLGVEPAHNSKDLLRDETALADAVSPALTPLARWPGRDRYPLVLLQQAAVNLAFSETRDGGLLGINGPPGTGKTTLLRDLVAGVVADRAEAMAKFDDPELAFNHSGQQLRVSNSWLHLYQLDASLRGFEMVVASSNNKAVENVSAELPGLTAIANDAPELRYFKSLSDALHQTETWGVIAAVLGNMQNRSRFKQTFWWDNESGLSSYLRVAAGAPPAVKMTDPKTGRVEQHTPHIVEAEQPPSTHQEALARWGTARKRFLNTLKKSRQSQESLEKLRTDLARVPNLAQAEVSAETKFDSAAAKVRKLHAEAGFGQEERATVESELEDADQQLTAHDLSRPGFWARLFRTRRARMWAELRRALLHQQNAESDWRIARTEHEQTKKRLADAERRGIILAGCEFFAVDHGKRHQTTPWFTADAQRLRDEVFISAIALHRAFIDAAAKPLRHNIGALMNVFTTQTLPNAAKQALLPDLWASLFLVVPLVSTTFASVNRMLGKLPLESLGWLFVDEAGQALPQAAVGALLRSRRAVAVGDPLQIEPVVSLPDRLANAICLQFGVDPDHYGAPAASVQTLADAASTYISEFPTTAGSRSVGVPLLVHRRCSAPMFNVSNAIAYSGLMVFAKDPRPSAIQDVLGPSTWIHVEGSGEDKWCREEGDEVLRILRQLAQAGSEPDLYIISPFVIVAERLRDIVINSGVLEGWIVGDDWRWTNERIGTVHTVQGREAEAIILVLGAPLPAQTGARGWAGGRPNLLNVAVTRAKEAIYVVGNRSLWKTAGLFSELDKRLR